MNDMMLFSDNISGFSVCRPFPPSEGVQKTRKNAHLLKVGKVRWTGKCGDRHLSWRCCICPPSEGVRKTQETARLRKVGKAWWREKRGYSRLSWVFRFCAPSEGVRKMQETAHLRKVEQKVGRIRWEQGRGLAVIVGTLLLCVGYFHAGAVSVHRLWKNMVCGSLR